MKTFKEIWSGYSAGRIHQVSYLLKIIANDSFSKVAPVFVLVRLLKMGRKFKPIAIAGPQT